MTDHPESASGDHRTFSTEELAEVAAGIRRLLSAIQSGEIASDRNSTLRLEGAAAAIEALAGGQDVT